jgi:hypothetical protein
MVEDSYQLTIKADDDIRRELAEENINLMLQRELEKELGPQAKVTVGLAAPEPDRKEVVLVIIAAGVTVNLVATAVAKVMRAWRQRKGHTAAGTGSVQPEYQDKTTMKFKAPGIEIEISSETKA